MVGSAIDSAIAQTYAPVEIIVVDDGSNDETYKITAQYGSKIKYYFKENGGVSSARNLGIAVSSGSLIAFLDSDDEWLPDKLEKQVDFLKSNPDLGMVICDSYFINGDRKILSRTNRRRTIPRDGYMLEEVLASPFLIPSTVLLKREVLESIGCFDEDIKTAEDLDLHLRIASNYKIGLVAEPLVSCMSGQAGLSMLSRTYDDHVFVVERFISLHRNAIDGKLRKKVIFETYYSAAVGKYWMKEWRAGIGYSLKATEVAISSIYFLKIAKMWAIGVKQFLNCCKA